MPRKPPKTPLPVVLADTCRKDRVEAVLRDRFGLEPHVQVVPVPNEKRTIVLLDGVPVDMRTSLAGLKRLARRIAKALGGCIHGTVNLDFVSIGDPATFAMAVEIVH